MLCYQEPLRFEGHLKLTDIPKKHHKRTIFGQLQIFFLHALFGIMIKTNNTVF